MSKRHSNRRRIDVLYYAAGFVLLALVYVLRPNETVAAEPTVPPAPEPIHGPSIPAYDPAYSIDDRFLKANIGASPALAYQVAKTIVEESSKSVISTDLLLSVVWEESLNHYDVVSYADAVGLMQMTQVACDDYAQRHKVACNMNQLRTDPVYNIKVGTGYLRDMLDQSGGDWDLALTAYNRGVYGAEKFLRQAQDEGRPTSRYADCILSRVGQSKTNGWICENRTKKQEGE